jgi:hypothetical protein
MLAPGPAMSVLEVKTGLLSLSPRMREQGGRIYIRTSSVFRLLSLWSYTRTVVVDPGSRRVEVHVRHLWAWVRHRVIPFARIDHIDYRFGSLTTAWSWFYGATDQLEKFSLALVLDDDERIPVASFRGAGSVMTGLGGALWGDTAIDYAGNQEDVSRALVELLVDVIGVPLGKPLASARVRACSVCGRHANLRDRRCTACGGEIARA